jgi:vacuolar protein sorting-associated protein 33A
VSFDAEFDCLIMMDRNVDMVSPFCSQQVYEGRLDETFGIKTTMIQVETKILNPKWEPKPGESEMTEMQLNNEDFLFKEVRGMSLGGVGVVTREKLKEIQEVMKEKDNPTNITELSKYVTKVKSMNIAKRKELLDYHINMASHVKTVQSELEVLQLIRLEQ